MSIYVFLGQGNFRVRVIYDLRKLNLQTVKNLYPIPNIKMLLQKMRNKKYFGMVDLKGTPSFKLNYSHIIFLKNI